MPLWTVSLLATLVTAVFAGTALLRRARRDLASEQGRADSAQAAAAALDRSLTEQSEREALAREVHDVLGHRLSLVAMQANVLAIEADEAGHPALARRSQQIQEGTASAMDDLRSLLQMMRREPTTPGRPSDLQDIAALVKECIDAGTPVSSSVFVDQSEPLDPVVSRSAHRIVTELLTNARKHSPGELVQLEITGDPATGLTIRARNPYHPGTSTGRGTGSGLVGIGQRAESLGGRFTAGPSRDGSVYEASASLPWRLSPTPARREP